MVSSAKPKIADYPFTTLVPNLGVVRKPDGDGMVIADIPGLIKGASEGAGLGHNFIKHIERTKLLVHIIDAAGTDGTAPLDAYQVIQNELKQYNKILLKKKQLLVLNKIDLLQDEECKSLKQKFKEKKLNPLLISAATKRNVDQLLKELFKAVEKIPQDNNDLVQTFYDPKATDHKNEDFMVYREKKKYFVEGKRISGLVSVTDLKDYQSSAHLMKVLKSMGVFDELQKNNIKTGDIVYISGIKFEYDPDTLIGL